MSFVHLHVHSHYSLLDGLTQIKPLVRAAKQRGFEALALTDYGSMYGAIEFYQACLAEKIKPIIGFEAYIAPRGLNNKDLQLDKEVFHLVLLAQDYEGYKNLMIISSRGHLEGFFNGGPRIDKQLLKERHQGIIALSGCIKGEIPTLIKQGRFDEAKQAAREYEEIFGKNYFYLELQDHPAIEGQMEVNTKLIQLSKETDVPLVVSRDVHYLNSDEKEAQDILTCVREGWHINQPDREDFRAVDRSLNTAEDVLSRFRHIPEALANTVKIAERVNIEIPLNQWHFAPVDLPPGKTSDHVLEELVNQNVGKFYGAINEEIKQRLDYEMGVIKRKGYSPYFLCVADYVKYAKEHGIIETTRGSAAGSLVSYVLGITTVDPLRFKLPFERFLNPLRPSPPDIDTDFADDRRDEMIGYVTIRYGREKAAQIITFGTMAARASIRDVGRALGFSYSFCDQVAKLIPFGSQGFPMTIERALKEEPDLKKLYQANPDVRRLIDLAQKVEGCARHTSIHAAGVVIAPSNLTEFTPVQYEVGGSHVITQYDMYSVEAAGLLKMDFLGIRNLAILGKAVEIVEKTVGHKVDVYSSLPLDDKETFEMLARGETMGTFQLGGSGMTHWLKELKPSSINDIMAMVALYRPGPMDSIPEYIRRKHNPELIEYLDPRMAKYLDASYGLLVYQDDVLLTAVELAGYNWEEADKFRRAIGKKIPAEMEKQKQKFFEGCAKHGRLPEIKIHRLWELIEPFAAYGFNKAHAASYGIVAYQTSYMKAHYPVQYMTAVLQAESGDTEKVAEIVNECQRMGIEVLPPDVNESFRNFAMVSKPGEQGRIRFGLTAIKNLGEHISEVIYRERKDNGLYNSLEDFIKRIHDKDLNKKSLESLIKAGALDCFGYNRGLLLANVENILAFSRQVKGENGANQHSLFAGTEIGFKEKINLKDVADSTLDERLKWEKELLGLYVSSHPFKYYQNLLKGRLIPINEAKESGAGQWVVIGGIVNKVKKRMAKKGGVLIIANIEDTTGSVEFLIFPKIYEQTQGVWIEGNAVCVVARTSREEGDDRMFVEKAAVMTKDDAVKVCNKLSYGVSVKDYAPQMQEKSIVIKLSKDELRSKADDLKDLFTQYPGDYHVYIQVGNNTIRAQSLIDWHSEVLDKLEQIIGEGRVEVFD